MIGIFDSGVGGMTVARAIEQFCPGFPFVYLGDIARTPYGSKSPNTIADYSHRNTDFLLNNGAKIIVVACNSAASTAGEALRAHYDLPIIDVIKPATRKAAAVSKNGKIGVIGTRATIQTDIYRQRIQKLRPDSKVYSQSCPLLVPLVEEGWLNRRETRMITKKYLYPLRCNQIDTLVLGCTHYPLLKHIFTTRIGKNVQIIDSSVEVALCLQSFLQQNTPMYSSLFAPDQPSRFFVSDTTTPAQDLASKIFGRTIQLEKTDV